MKKIWFNKNLSVISNYLFEKLKMEDLKVFYTHTRDDISVPCEINFSLEPSSSSDVEYIDWCLSFCKENKIDVFYPWRNIKTILKNRTKFEDIGVIIYSTVPDYDTFNNINNKSRFYDLIIDKKLKVEIPEYYSVSKKEDFIANANYLYKTYEDICMKPAIGIFASGYKRIYNDNRDFQRVLNGTDKYKISYETLKYIMPDNIPEMIVMKFLPGNEYSYDCLCHNGEIIAGAIRVKYVDENIKYQTITNKIEGKNIKEYSKTLVKELNLSGFINIQYIDDEEGIPNVLEINPRMSGGFYKCDGTDFNWGKLFADLINGKEIKKEKNTFNYDFSK